MYVGCLFCTHVVHELLLLSVWFAPQSCLNVWCICVHMCWPIHCGFFFQTQRLSFSFKWKKKNPHSLILEHKEKENIHWQKSQLEFKNASNYIKNTALFDWGCIFLWMQKCSSMCKKLKNVIKMHHNGPMYILKKLFKAKTKKNLIKIFNKFTNFLRSLLYHSTFYSVQFYLPVAVSGWPCPPTRASAS